MADKFSSASGNQTQPEGKRPQAVLVCGVDIDGSTALKIKNPLVNIGISKFMHDFDRQLRKLDSEDGDSARDDWVLWRVRGDELVYFRIIPIGEDKSIDYQSIQRYINQFIKVMEMEHIVSLGLENNMHLGLHGYAFLLHAEDDWDFSWNLISKDWKYKTEKQQKVEEIEGDPQGSASVIFEVYENSIREIQNDYFIDFIGRDVDLGFRIAEYSRPHFFVLSPKLARCILNGGKKNKNEIKRDVLFFGFHELKGCSIGGGGPDRFPLYFLPIRNKGRQIKRKMLNNYRLFSVRDAEKKLIEFEKYERRSCEIIFDKVSKQQKPVVREGMQQRAKAKGSSIVGKMMEDMEELKQHSEGEK
ncbi:hypothetical protein [Rothia sp. RSM292]|uniref:hypothetical protein n=1 Tax=Rothia sp. RSM292 TaxID=3030212 RepID=UPI00244D4022|nr:hypothetical protein [Rothia sp. RSM292]